jgi:hypothetical protein
MVSPQNVYPVRGLRPRAGKIIEDYLVELSSGVASKVVSAGVPVDWLVVDAGGLQDVAIKLGGMKDFEEFLERALRVHDPRFSVVRGHTHCICGYVNQEKVEEWIRKYEPHVDLKYVAPLDLDANFTGYHLDMRNGRVQSP